MMRLWWLKGLAIGVVAWMGSGATSSRVTLEAGPTGWRLVRNGEPYFVRGAVGTHQMERLKACGGNSVRTGPAALDQAAALGLSCLVGLPLGNPRQGFDYADAPRVAAQFDRIRQIVRQHREHPALLLWAIGNEPEIFTQPEQRVALWREVDRIARMVKEEDPNHPVITVLGDTFRHALAELDQYCPSLDAVGLNAYQDMLTLPEDVARQAWRRPYLVTEFGPRGHWQVKKTAWKAPIEDTSTAKAGFYREAYEHAVEGRTNCLGAYVFYWAHKQEKTHTWYGMFLADGSRTEAIDVMEQLWTGRAPTNRCPQIGPAGIEVSRRDDQGGQRGRRESAGVMLQAGHEVAFRVAASDPEGDALSYEWDLRQDGSLHPGVGGDPEPSTPPLAGAIRSRLKEGAGVEVKLPRQPGIYRLFVYVRDGQGGAATANLPILLATPGASPPGER